MPTSAMTALATLTLASAQATVTFSSISGAYRDLRLVINAKHPTTSTSIYTVINDDSGANYNYVTMLGNGSTTNSQNNSGFTVGLIAGSGILNTTSMCSIVSDWLDYSATNKHKSFNVRADNADYGSMAISNRWASTSAIVKIMVRPGNATTFAAGSTFTLFGVSA